MKKRVLTSLATIALASTLVGGATFALFTSQATNNDNTFKAGTLKVLAGQQTYTVPVTNLKPGDKITGSFTVTNDGSLPLSYAVTPSATGVLFEGGVDLNLDGVNDANHAIVALKTNSTGDLEKRGDNTTVTYEIDFPSIAGDDFQGAAGALTFTVDATQK